MDRNSAQYLGLYGYGWSNTAAVYAGPLARSTATYNLAFNNSAVGPSNGPWERRVGFPVRCLVILVSKNGFPLGAKGAFLLDIDVKA